MQTIYVIAGNRNEYQEYSRSDRRDYLKTYYYVRDVDSLRGVRNPDGVFIGSFKNRPDIKELLAYMLVVMDNPNKIKVIRNIYESIQQVEYTATMTSLKNQYYNLTTAVWKANNPSSTYDTFKKTLDAKAAAMANELDQELLKELLNSPIEVTSMPRGVL